MEKGKQSPRLHLHSVTTDKPVIDSITESDRPSMLLIPRSGRPSLAGGIARVRRKLTLPRNVWTSPQVSSMETNTSTCTECVLLDNRTGTTTTTTRMCSFLPWRYLWIELRLRGGYLHDPCAPFICETETWITTVLCPVAPAARASWFPDLPCPRRFLCRAGPGRSTGTFTFS